MDTLEPASTSWGSNSTEVDPRALRRLNQLLDRMAVVGEALVYGALLAVLASVVWMGMKTNFENLIFYDGTDNTCVYDGQTGEIRNVQ